MQHISAVIYSIILIRILLMLVESILLIDSIRKRRTVFTYFFSVDISLTICLVVVVLLYWSRG